MIGPELQVTSGSTPYSVLKATINIKVKRT